MNEDDYPAWYQDDSHEGYQQWDEAEAKEDAHYDREQQMRDDYESMVAPNPYGESPPGNPWG